MFRLAWLGVRFNPGRYIATLVAIVTGVAFFAATGFLSDRVINALEGDANRQYGGIDVAIVADDASGTTATSVEQQRIPGDVADRITATDGVTASGGVLTGRVAFLKSDGSTFGDNATGRLWIVDDQLNPIDIDSGAAPAASGEIAVDKGLADKNDLAVGDSVTVLTLAGEKPAKIVGITHFGGTDALDSGGTVSISAADAFNWLSSGIEEYEEFYLRTDRNPADVVADLADVVPSGFHAETGAKLLQDKRDEVGAPGRYLKIALQLFALLALFVGGFVIYNTFSVIVTQRLRELAVMAAIGATPKQIKRALRYEGLVLGLLGSAIGVVVGFALAFVLILAFKAFGVDLAGSGITVRPIEVVQSLLAGTVITLVSVMIPARRAAKTEPIEALRTAAVERSPLSRKRIITAVTMVVLGAAGLLFGNAALLGIGALLLFVGVIVAGPIIAIGSAWVFRPLLSRFGLVGQLAVDNTARSPQRTATTANALLIGVFLVTLVSVAGQSAKDFVVGEINKLETADYLLQSTGGTIDDALINNLQSIDGVQQVVPFRREAVTLDGKPSLLSTGNLTDLQQVAGIEAKEGTFADLGDATIAVVDQDGGPKMGATVTVADSNGQSQQLTVTVIMKQTLDTGTTGSFVNASTFDSLVGDTAPTVAFLDLATGAQTDTRDAIEDSVKLRPDIELTEGNFLARLIGQVFDFLINAVNGLLGMSVIIALIGIINTLSLSILERRRELGLLRAVGMTDRRVKQMVRVESVLIAALGTITGLVVGLFVAWSLVHSLDRLAETHVDFSLPIVRLVLILVLGVVLGVLASLIPARRSTRLDVLDAIQAT